MISCYGLCLIIITQEMILFSRSILTIFLLFFILKNQIYRVSTLAVSKISVYKQFISFWLIVSF
jgi:hypothetical protein